MAPPPITSSRACLQQVIRGLEREKERFAGEAAGVNAKYRAAVEEVAARDAAIADLQRKIEVGSTSAHVLGQQVTAHTWATAELRLFGQGAAQRMR